MQKLKKETMKKFISNINFYWFIEQYQNHIKPHEPKKGEFFYRHFENYFDSSEMKKRLIFCCKFINEIKEIFFDKNIISIYKNWNIDKRKKCLQL